MSRSPDILAGNREGKGRGQDRRGETKKGIGEGQRRKEERRGRKEGKGRGGRDGKGEGEHSNKVLVMNPSLQHLVFICA